MIRSHFDKPARCVYNDKEVCALVACVVFNQEEVLQMRKYVKCGRVLCVLGACLILALGGCPLPPICPDSILGKWTGSTTLYGDSSPTAIAVVFKENTLTLSTTTPFGCTDTIKDIPYSYANCKATFDRSYQLSGDCYGGRSIQGRLQGKMTFITEDKMKVDAYHGYRGLYDGEWVTRDEHIVFTLRRVP